MKSILLIVFVVGMLFLLATLLRGLYRILTAPGLTNDFLRSGVTLGSLWSGRVPKQDDGSLVATREGMRLSSKNGVRRLITTRSLRRDIF